MSLLALIPGIMARPSIRYPSASDILISARKKLEQEAADYTSRTEALYKEVAEIEHKRAVVNAEIEKLTQAIETLDNAPG